MSYEISHSVLAREGEPHWFVANLDPNFEHCFLPYYNLGPRAVDIKCTACGNPLYIRSDYYEAERLSDDPNEFMELDQNVVISAEAREFFRDLGVSGCSFVPVRDIDSHESGRADAFLIAPIHMLRNGLRYECTSGCSVCGNRDVQCSKCRSALRHCPGCGRLRKYEHWETKHSLAATLSDWRLEECVLFKGSVLLTGRVLRSLLLNKFFGFTFREVIVEAADASQTQIDCIRHATVELSDLLPLVPGGSDQNEQLMKSII